MTELNTNVVHMPVQLGAGRNTAPARTGRNQNKFGKKKRLNHLRGRDRHENLLAATSELLNHLVCATNGQNYKNFCELKKASCHQNREMKIFYFGKCSKLLSLYSSYKTDFGILFIPL